MDGANDSDSEDDEDEDDDDDDDDTSKDKSKEDGLEEPSVEVSYHETWECLAKFISYTLLNSSFPILSLPPSQRRKFEVFCKMVVSTCYYFQEKFVPVIVFDV